MSTVRHYRYRCAAYGREIESTTSLFVRWETNAQIRVCRAACTCGQPMRRTKLLAEGAG